MNLKLTRIQSDVDGIFGKLTDEVNALVAVTLEHAYNTGSDEGYIAKIPPGTYTCKRSQHTLHGMTKPFETFQVMDVPGHSNILFHWGNFNGNSDGCILLGRKIIPVENTNEHMITNSRNTFNKLMDIQKGVDTFTLEIV